MKLIGMSGVRRTGDDVKTSSLHRIYFNLFIPRQSYFKPQ